MSATGKIEFEAFQKAVPEGKGYSIDLNLWIFNFQNIYIKFGKNELMDKLTMCYTLKGHEIIYRNINM